MALNPESPDWLAHAVRELLDRAAIRDVLMRYAQGVDRADLEQVASCFTPDADYQGSLAQGTIGNALPALRAARARFESTMHFMGNQLIQLRGDEALCETYAVAYHRLKAEPERALVVGIRYLDDLVRQGNVWRIRKRVAKLEWQRYDALATGEE
jgi:hypothetical protein